MLVRPSPSKTMPKWPYCLDMSHPLAAGLGSLHVFDPTQLHRLIDLSPMRTAGDVDPLYAAGPTPVPRALPLGGGWSTRGVGEWPNLFLGAKGVMNTPVQHTLACLHAWSDQVTAAAGYLTLANTFFADGWWLGKFTGNAEYQYIIGDGASDTRLNSAGSAMTFDWTPRMVVATNDGLGNAALHVQGKGKWTSGTFKTTIGQAYPLRIGYERNGNGAFQGDMYLFAVWHRVLSDGEIARLYHEPFGMLRSVSPRYLMQGVQAGGGGPANAKLVKTYLG